MPGCKATESCMPAFIPLVPTDEKSKLGDLGKATFAFETIWMMVLLSMALAGSMTPWFLEQQGAMTLQTHAMVQPPAPAASYTPPVQLGALPTLKPALRTPPAHWAEGKLEHPTGR